MQTKTKDKKKDKNKGWNPFRSKWAAAIKIGLDVAPGAKDNLLYLGASAGTTVSHVAELTSGMIFAVENSSVMAISLIKLAEKRKNIAPLFCDARDTDYIKKAMFGKKINILFQDIPSVDQVEILIKASSLVDKDCRILFSLKTQSISQQNPEKTLKEATNKLKAHFDILKTENLEPYHKKHYFFILKKKA